MARLANAIKMGYFPTPGIVFELLTNWLTLEDAESTQRLLDPCAGRGEVAQLADLLDESGASIETLGVELSPERADAAAQVMDQVYNAAWRQVRINRESISFLWLNPPYDHDLDGDSRRLEIEFLQTAAPKLMTGGVMAYVIPQRLLGYKGVAMRLAGHFDHLVIRRFPDGEFERFKQVIALGVKKPYKTPTGDEVKAIQHLASEELAPLGETPEAPWPMVIPAATSALRFRRVSLPDREQVARSYAAGWPDEMLQAMRYQEQIPFQPVVTPKKGHVAMIMSSGMTGTMEMRKHGHTLLVKGRTTRESITRVETDENGENPVHIVTHRPRASVGVIGDDEVRVIDETEDLSRFMEHHGDVLAEEILNKPPLYDFDPPQALWEHLGRLSTWREPLDGQEEPGLLDTQKHAAIAMMYAMQETKSGVGLIQGEMGTGKTTVALSAIDLMDAYPALVLCPPHMVDKWKREAREVIGPDVQTRELRRIGRTASMDQDVNHVREFLEDWEDGTLGDKAVAVVSSTSAKLGPGWEGAMATRYTLPRDEDQRAKFRDALHAYKTARRQLMIARDPEKLQASIDRVREHIEQARRGESRLGYDDLKGSLRRMLHIKYHRREYLEEQRSKVRTLRHAALDEALSQAVCPHCGKVQWEGPQDSRTPVFDFKTFNDKPMTCSRAVQGWARDDNGGLITDDEGRPIWIWEPETNDEFGAIEPVPHAPMCNHALYQFGARYRRIPIADYIKDHASDAFKMLVVDEIHHYKGKSSDRGIAFARLVDSVQWVLGLTGTLYGGKARSIYWLGHRLGLIPRSVFPYNSARKWVRWYGVLEERTYGSRSDGDAYSAYNATKKRKIVKEKPGVSPAILRYLIDNTIFLTLKDLGVGLPSYQEEIVKIEMSDQQAEQYRRMFTTLKARAKEDRRYLSTFLQWSLGRPNSGFRDEEVIKEHRDDDGNVVKRERLCTLPAVVDTSSDDDAELMDPSGSFREGVLLPKERWLVNYTNSEVDAGRKVIVYVRQTATRDIRGRLKDVLEATGLRARILDSSVGTREREAWVERYENSTDVLIVNPRLVETGLDLVQFSTVVFYEISYSLYTMWQAMRRVWRLGQRRPVKVVFAVYRETIERRAAGQMGDKMRGAQLLFGDEVGGALVPEEGDNFLTQLARNALEGKELRDLQAIFAEAHPKTTNSPMGSPTVKSPRMTMAKMRSLWLKQKYKGNDGRRRKKRVHEAQQTLF